jgi:hypothetical protein
MPRKRNLPEPVNGSTLPTMVGAVIYVRVSTKEQTENLSLPTQLRACEEYWRRLGGVLAAFAQLDEDSRVEACQRKCRCDNATPEPDFR